jgi:hypothetical protein
MRRREMDRIKARAGRWRFLILLVLFSSVLLCTSCNSKGTTKDIVNAHITRESLKNVEIALELYRKEFGNLPETLDELLMRKGITDRSIIEDAWGRTYHYVKLDDSYNLFSNGRDGKPFTSDDIHPK